MSSIFMAQEMALCQLIDDFFCLMLFLNSSLEKRDVLE